MKEETAKTKWCPFTRTGLLAGSGGVAVNRSVESVEEPTNGPYSVYDSTRCIGSACMMWAWYDSSFTWNEKGPRPETDPKDPQGDCGLSSMRVHYE